MRLRTFTASSMPKALSQVKAALGDDAIILSVEEKEDGVHITAATEPDDSPAIQKSSSKQETSRTPSHNIDQLRYDVQHHLRFHNLPELFIAKLSAKLNDADIAVILGKTRINMVHEGRHFLKLALEHICSQSFGFAPLPEAPHKLMLVGMPGTGKTLAIAKLATQYVLAGKKTALITTDVQRAGSSDQLKSFADILGVPLAVCANKKALTTELKLVGKGTHCLIDTAGCNPYQEENLAELAEYAALAGVETALVMPAGIDAQEAMDATEAFMTLPISRLVISRADCARRFGGPLAVSAAHHLPLSFASDSASVADNITELNAKTLVQYLLKP